MKLILRRLQIPRNLEVIPRLEVIPEVIPEVPEVIPEVPEVIPEVIFRSYSKTCKLGKIKKPWNF